MPRPNKLHDELDALLDGRPVELTEDLAPLVEAADVLRAELAAYGLDPEVADRHLERVLEGSATVVPMPAPQQPDGWDLRRRVAAVVLAAALVLAPATMASAAALPGQAMYPFKLAIEQLRLASVQWSVTREAGERTRVADERLDELERLVEMKMFNQLPTAINALRQAVVAARVAVTEAERDGEPVPGVLAKLNQVKGQGALVVGMVVSRLEHQQPLSLTGGTREAIQAAAQNSQAVLSDPTVGPTETPTTTPESPPPSVSTPTDPGGTPTTDPPASAPQTTSAPATTQPTTSAPTTTAAPPTTQPPPSTEGSETPGSVEMEPADGRSQDELPPSTIAGP